ncbi:MAG: FHA domain-containing protein [Roseiflexaceae bacterium]
MLYAALINLHQPSADFVLINDRGVGVLELKHSAGKITSRDGVWYAGEEPIKAGTRTDIKNPHSQVQAYTKTIRSTIARELANWWGIPDPEVFRQINVQTAVCFTNHEAQIDDTRADIEREAQANRRPWEVFSILKPTDIPAWALRLSFGMQRGRDAHYAPYTLQPTQMVDLATRVFHVAEWTEIRGLMPEGQPYAYLLLKEEGRWVQYFALKAVETTIGRNSARCDIQIPATYGSASRVQARLIRVAGQLFIEDLGSSQGTFVDGTRIERRTQLKAGLYITLGGAQPGPGICELHVTTTLPDELIDGLTELATPKEPVI